MQQTYFSKTNIRLSGGSQSHRQYLSTIEYNLTHLISKLGFSEIDIYNSLLLNKHCKDKKFEIPNPAIPNNEECISFLMNFFNEYILKLGEVLQRSKHNLNNELKLKNMTCVGRDRSKDLSQKSTAEINYHLSYLLIYVFQYGHFREKVKNFK